MRKFFLVFRSEGKIPAFSVIEGENLMEALYLERERKSHLPMADLVLAFDMNPNSPSVDELKRVISQAVAKHLGIAGITD